MTLRLHLWDNRKGQSMNLDKNMYKPISFWSWNGDMREEEIRWQISEFKEKGYGGFFIHSRAGRLISYMGDDWLGACAVAIDEAEKQGLYVWLYDEDGWPSGFAGGLVNGCGEAYCAKQLRFRIGKPQDEMSRVIAVYRKTAENSYIRINNEAGTGEDLYCFYQIVPHYVDIMDRRTIARFIEVTHEVYKEHFGQYFGRVIKGIFTDEPQLPEGPCWSSEIEERYQQQYQVEIKDDLWLLHVDGEGCEQFRYCFWKCVNELVNENFVCQISDWCKENQLLLTGHFFGEDGLNDQMLASGGVMSLYQNMGIPGIDHLGNRYASSVLMKQVTSVAHQRNLPGVLSESFGCSGWETSFKELLGIAGWHAVFGVNMLCTHVSAYTIIGRRKRDYPLFFSYQEPWWEDTKILFQAIERLNTEIGKGARQTDVAVLHPIRSIWCMNTPERRYEGRFISADFRELVDNLLDLHIDFDLLDEGKLENGKHCSYSYLIVPNMTAIGEYTARVLCDFAKQGGKIIFMNGRPKSIEGDKKHFLLKEIEKISAPDVQNTRHILQKYVRQHPIQDDFHLYDARMENEVSGLISNYRKTNEGAVVYLFNPVYGHQVSTVLRQKGICELKKINLLDGSETQVTATYGGEYTFAHITVEAGTGVLLKIENVTERNKKRIKPYETKTLMIQNIELLADNALTIDIGRYSINEGMFSEKKPIIHMLDEIYGELAGKDGDSKVCIEYTFYADFKEKPSHLFMAIEKADELTIELNQKLVSKEVGWWIDKGIRKYDITDFVENGENKVLLTYIISNTKQIEDWKGKFESERNRFFYKVEPESIYIGGAFDVKCNAKVEDYVTYYATVSTLQQNIFTLVDRTKKNTGDLTSQGMWFYRGDCAYTGQLEYDGKSKRFLRIDEIHCTGAKIYVNQQYAGMVLASDDECNITEYMHMGMNEIKIVAMGHNRNLLGPHHHMRGKLYFVGQNSFMGTKGFEDFVSPDVVDECTWTDQYSFVPFGLEGIRIKVLEE